MHDVMTQAGSHYCQALNDFFGIHNQETVSKTTEDVEVEDFPECWHSGGFQIDANNQTAVSCFRSPHGKIFMNGVLP